MTSKTRKMCMIGDYGVGKTSLIRRFVERQFNDQYLSTVGVKISRKTVSILNSHSNHTEELKLLIWDIEGQTKFKAIAPSYLQGATGVLIVADLERKETVEHFLDHARLCYSVNPNMKIMMALNKVDLVSQEELNYLLDLSNSYLRGDLKLLQIVANLVREKLIKEDTLEQIFTMIKQNKNLLEKYVNINNLLNKLLPSAQLNPLVNLDQDQLNSQIKVYPTSAKTGNNVDDIFDQLALEMLA